MNILKLKKLLLVMLLSTVTLLAVPFENNFCTTNSINIPVAECQALEDLWFSTHGENWKDQTGWGVDPNVATWKGITLTDDNTSVKNIMIFSNNLTGELPDNIDGFTHLEIFSLSGNHLFGNIPLNLKNISPVLDIFAINNNEYNGTLPLLQEANNIRVLGFGGNNFTGSIPQSYNTFAKLEKIYADDNNLSGALPNFSDLNLTTFNIIQNDFTFADIEPQVSWLDKIPDSTAYGKSLQYSHQLYIKEANHIVYFDDVLEIHPSLAENPTGNDHYTWVKDDDTQTIIGTERVYVKHTATLADEGAYNYEVNNTVLTRHPERVNLILYSEGDPRRYPSSWLSRSLHAKHDYKPELSNLDPLKVAKENTLYKYSSDISDKDDDDLTVSSLTLPTWLTLTSDASSFSLSGTPSYDDAGSYDINITVTDGKIPVHINYTLTIAENLPTGYTIEDNAYTHTATGSSIIVGDSYYYSFPKVNEEEDIELYTQSSNWRDLYEKLTPTGALTTGYFNNHHGNTRTPTLASSYPLGSKATILKDPDATNKQPMLMIDIPLTSATPSITIGQ